MRSILIRSFVLLAVLGYGIVAGRRELPPVNWMKDLRDRVMHTGAYDKTPRPAPPPDPVVEDLISVGPNTIDSMRNLMIDLVYGPDGVPSSLPDTVAGVVDREYADLENLLRLERFVVVQEHDIRSVGYVFHPKNSVQRLLVYHQGHDGDFIYGKHTIAHFVRQGFTVYAFSMPLIGMNNQPLVEKGKLGHIRMNNHAYFQFLEHPIRFFIAPVSIMLNHASEQGFRDISMAGISGGGWTTTLAAAMDVRIKHSFPVAGSYPMFIKLQRPTKNMGDFEQYYSGLYPFVDYLDMYVMGATGDGRSQTQILNTYDPCCFDGNDHVKYAASVSNAVRSIGPGSFRVYADTTLRKHDISAAALKEMDRELGIP